MKETKELVVVNGYTRKTIHGDVYVPAYSRKVRSQIQPKAKDAPSSIPIKPIKQKRPGAKFKGFDVSHLLELAERNARESGIIKMPTLPPITQTEIDELCKKYPPSKGLSEKRVRFICECRRMHPIRVELYRRCRMGYREVEVSNDDMEADREIETGNDTD